MHRPKQDPSQSTSHFSCQCCWSTILTISLLIIIIYELISSKSQSETTLTVYSTEPYHHTHHTDPSKPSHTVQFDQPTFEDNDKLIPMNLTTSGMSHYVNEIIERNTPYVTLTEDERKKLMAGMLMTPIEKERFLQLVYDTPYYLEWFVFSFFWECGGVDRTCTHGPFFGDRTLEW